MVRKMAYIGSSYFIGLLFASFLGLNLLLLIPIIVISIIIIIVKKNRRTYVTAIAISLLIGVSVYNAYERFSYKPAMDINDSEYTLKGIITDISNEKSDLSSYLVKTSVNGKTCYVKLYYTSLVCDYYDEIAVTGTLHPFENTYLFPSKDYNEAKNILFEVRNIKEITTKSRFSILKPILHYRDYISDTISKYLPNQEGEFLNAMLCGDKTGVDSDIKLMMYRSGIGHIMAVSGVHLVIMAGVVFYILSTLRINRKISFIILCVLVLAFTAFAGFSLSVIRSAVMIIVVYSAPLFKRQYDCYSSLGLAVILITIIQPYAIRDISFLLSVSGTFGLGVVAPKICSYIKYDGKMSKQLKLAVSFICVNLTVLPFSLMFFDEISLISPVTNLLLVPLCMAALAISFIVVLTGGINIIAFPLLMICGVISKFVIFASEFVGSLSFTYIAKSDMYLIILISISVLSIILSSIIFKRFKNTAITSLICVTAIIISVFVNNHFNKDLITAAYLTNGKNSGLVLLKNSNAVIIDFNSDYKVISMTRKYLLQNGVRNIQCIAVMDNYDSKYSSYLKQMSIFKIENINEFDTANLNFGYNIYISDTEARIEYGEFSLFYTDGATESLDNSVIILYNGILPECTFKKLVCYNKLEELVSYSGNTVIKFDEKNRMKIGSL